ncbi:MAG: hypothetical protein DMG05_09115 [Acidobacteria bacterium]|nr:MAG: hypothetical protein DMG05_09115 [Acidobacteriota bacterium]
MTIKAIEILVCFKDKLKNTYITVATEDVSEARRIARIWGGKKEGEPVMRTIFKQEVSFPDQKPEIVDGVKVWPASF